jgi:hypothetical protein
VIKRCPLFLAVASASVWLATKTTTTGDWSIDAWPAVRALADGHVGDYLSAKTMMGPFATLVQAPFATLSSSSELEAYRWASLPCLLALGLLGIYLATIARRRGAPPLTQLLIGALCLLNPLTLQALEGGHPEELLTGALAVGAVATAAQGHRGRTAILLGLAISSKQWAVIAVLPALMALSDRRLRVGLVAAMIATVLMLPGLLAAPGSFSSVQSSAAHTGRIVTPWSIWYPVATVTTEHYRVGTSEFVAHVHEGPPFVGTLSHPLIVLLALVLPLALALRRQGLSLSGGDAMALLALLALLRCVLDPVDNLYYHEPLLLALLGWDAFAARGLPLRGLMAAAVALLFWHWSHHLSDVSAFGATYLAIVLSACLAIGAALYRFPGWTVVRSEDSRFRRLFYGSEEACSRLRREA